MDNAFNELKTYISNNLETFCSTSFVVGYSKLQVPYIILLTQFGSYVKVEYSTDKHIINVYVSDNRLVLNEQSLQELAQFLMQINVKNTVGYWVAFPNIKRIAYKTTTKFPSQELDAKIVKELILSALSSYQTNIDRFAKYYTITQNCAVPAFVDFN